MLVNNALTIKEIKNIAWENARRNWTDLLLVVLLSMVLVYFTGSILYGPVVVGLYCVMHQSLAGRVVSPSIFIEGFKKNIITSIIAMILIDLASLLPSWIIGFLFKTVVTRVIRYTGETVASAMLQNPANQINFVNTTSVGLVVAIGVGLILCLAIYLLIALWFAMTMFIIYMDNDIGITDSLIKSTKVMKGNKCKLLLFDLSFTGWGLLTLVTFGLALFWVVPYYMSARTIFLDQIYKESPYRTFARETNHRALIDMSSDIVNHKKMQYDYEEQKLPSEKYCRYCGAEKKTDMKFCQICGEQQIDPSDETIDSTVLFCKFCGEQLDIGARFCTKCGRPQIEQAEERIITNQSKENIDECGIPEGQDLYERDRQEGISKKKIKSSTIIIIIASVLVAVGLGIGGYLLFGNSGGDEVDLESLVYTPSAYGYDGHGEMDMEMYIDEEKMNAYLGTIKNDERRSAVKGVLLTVLYYPDNCEKLSNGDEITITAEYDKEMAKDIELKVINDTFTYTVEGLEEGEDIAYDASLCDEYPEDFVFTDSDENYLDEAIAYYATSEDEDIIQRAINEIYARHGMIFTDSFYAGLYEDCVWYTPVYTKDEIKSSWFNEYENANLKFLADYRSQVKSDNSYVKCASCGEKMKKKDVVEEGGKYYCRSCYYETEYYNESYEEENVEE